MAPPKKTVTAAAAKPTSLSDEALELIASRFRALSEPMRLKLLNRLMQGERTVGQLVEETAGGQANVSKHLAVLRQAGMVAVRKEGTATFCSISDPAVLQLCDIMCSRLKERHEFMARILKESGLR